MSDINIKRLEELSAETRSRNMCIEGITRVMEDEKGEAKEYYNVVFSTDAPYTRGRDFDGVLIDEVLVHEDKAVDMKRMNDGAPMLFNHNKEMPIGVVKKGSAKMEKGKGSCEVRFSKNLPHAEQMKAAVDDGDLDSVSVGYRVYASEWKVERNDKDEIVRAIEYITDWFPYEVSLVATPADTNAKFTKSLESLRVIEHDNDEKDINNSIGERDMSDVNEKKEAAPAVQVVDDSAERAEAEAKAKVSGAEAERQRVEDIENVADLAKALPADELAQLKREAVRSGQAAREFQAAVAAKVNEVFRNDPGALNPANKLDLDVKDRKRYSVTKLIGYNASMISEKEAGFEIECSRAIASERGEKAFAIPYDVLAPRAGEARQRVNTTTNAADLVDETHAGQWYVENLRDMSVVLDAGVTVLPGLRGDFKIPRKTNSAAFSFKAETADASDTDLTFDNIPLEMKTATGGVAVTREMIMNANPAVDSIVMRDLAHGAALLIDTAVLAGDGTANNPRGILNTTGINTTATAGSITWSRMVNLQTLLREDDALMGKLCYIVKPAHYETMQTTLKDAATAGYIMSDNGMVAGYPVKVKTDNVLGDSNVLFGNFQECFLGVWNFMEFQRDTATLAARGGVVQRCFVDIDVAVRHAVSFATHDTTA